MEAEGGGQENPMKTIMGATEAARLIGYSPRRTRELLVEGQLGGVRIGGKWLVTAQAVIRFLTARRISW